MTTTIIIISIYVALVFIGYGMMLQFDSKNAKLDFATAALMIWVTVPFLILITFGKWMGSLNDKLNYE